MKKLFSIAAVAVLAVAAFAVQAAGLDLTAALSPDTLAALSMVGAAGITTWQQPGKTLTLTPSAAVASGVGHLFGVSLFGVATNDVASGAAGEFITEGVVEIGKTSALAIAVGDRVFWDATNKVVNKTASAQAPVGIAVAAAANPSATVLIKLGSYSATAA